MKSPEEIMRDFFAQCPFMEKSSIGINYLGACGKEYSIETVPTDTLIKKYVDGGEVRQYVFVLASREYFDAESSEGAQAARFYERLTQWIEEKNRLGEIPQLGEESLSLSAQSRGYLYAVRGNTARFQIQCRLIYRK